MQETMFYTQGCTSQVKLSDRPDSQWTLWKASLPYPECTSRLAQRHASPDTILWHTHLNMKKLMTGPSGMHRTCASRPHGRRYGDRDIVVKMSLKHDLRHAGVLLNRSITFKRNCRNRGRTHESGVVRCSGSCDEPIICCFMSDCLGQLCASGLASLLVNLLLSLLVFLPLFCFFIFHHGRPCANH